MSLAQALIAEFQHEHGLTTTVLERVPADRFTFKPHEKSMTAAGIMGHITEVPLWGVTTIEQDSYDLDMTTYKPYVPSDRDEVLGRYAANAEAFLAALPKASDEAMMAPWSMTVNGQPAFQMPRIACLRTMIFNHLVHHRAQLAVYLRLLDLPIPAIYGPSADEGPQMG